MKVLRVGGERPITINSGTNRLVDPERIVECARELMQVGIPHTGVPDPWDGMAAQRIAAVFRNLDVQ